MHVNTSAVTRVLSNCNMSHLKAGCETKKSHFEGQRPLPNTVSFGVQRKPKRSLKTLRRRQCVSELAKQRGPRQRKQRDESWGHVFGVGRERALFWCCFFEASILQHRLRVRRSPAPLLVHPGKILGIAF